MNAVYDLEGDFHQVRSKVSVGPRLCRRPAAARGFTRRHNGFQRATLYQRAAAGLRHSRGPSQSVPDTVNRTLSLSPIFALDVSRYSGRFGFRLEKPGRFREIA